MRFSPQVHEIFRHQNFKKLGAAGAFCTFWLHNVLFATGACNFSTSEHQKVLPDPQFWTFWLVNVLPATAACNFSTSELQKVLPDPQFLKIITCECAFRHSGVQFLDIWTSKSAPRPPVFEDYHLWMCFSPQRRTIFRHLNFKKCSRTLSFLTFSLVNVLLATAACNFSTSQVQKVLRSWGVLFILTSKCAFRQSGVQFLISSLTTFRLRYNRPTFRLTRHTNHWKNKAFRDFSNIWRRCIFFLLTFAPVHLLSADLTTLLCFVHIVGSSTSKLPSMN